MVWQLGHILFEWVKLMEYLAQDIDGLTEKYPFVKHLTDNVHGSGINSDWEGGETQDNIRIYNSFNVINENGYYDGFADFTVLIPKKKPMNFKIQWRNAPSRNLADRKSVV